MTQVILIDLVLAGDNALVVGLAAARVAPAQRGKVIFWGLAAAIVLRIAFSLIAVRLLAIVGLTLAGGILLLWVCWKLFRETQETMREHRQRADDATAGDGDADDGEEPRPGKSMRAAIGQIIVADVSMSLDNVLAVAGAAREHPMALVSGLLLSVALMGAAASMIAPLFKRWPWIAYIGLTVILYVAVEMIWSGGGEVLAYAQARV